MINKNKETLEIFNQSVDDIKPHMKIDYDFERLEAYLTVFDEIPLKEKERLIEYLVFMLWGYKDYKRKGVRKKSIIELEKAVITYQQAIRELHNDDVSDEFIYRNGMDNNYNGEYDFDDDFETSTHLWHLSLPLQTSYLANIELLKEIQEFNDDMEILHEAAILYGLKKPSMEFKNYYFEKKPNSFKIINPFNFIETHRPSKEHIKNVMYDIADKYSLNKYEIKQLIDSI